MPPLTLSCVRAALLETRSAYLSRNFATGGGPMCLFELNNGLCEEFAGDVVKALGLDPLQLEGAGEILVVQGENFQQDHDTEPTWDRALLAEHWNIQAPGDFAWQHADDVVFGTHVWVAARVGPARTWLHFDAECVDGAPSFFDLPLFRRYLQGAWPSETAVRRAAPDPVF